MTLTAPPITPCPVAWCPSAGHHDWDRDENADPSRIHKHVTMACPTGYGRTRIVAAEVWETEEGRTPSVELYDADALYSREHVEQVITGMRAAADLAFGPVLDTFGPERAELESAVAEVALRADNPQDVNRLVAAAIRLREAAAVLAEVTR